MEFKGLSINSGAVTGMACLYSNRRHKSVVQYALADEAAVKDELARFEQAVIASSAQLDAVAADVVKKIGMTEAEIFFAQKHIMNDPAILSAIRKGIAETMRNAESVIAEEFEKYENKFAASDNEYLRQRSVDIGDIRRRL
ncbi:MAG: phosphoenolpyruvate-utilizing N-terminal domain-containing protein, partial [Chitinivibrionales bacterium]|nr:phosphoenolpyruvate-utilizing N-terminal domain-containing protein [Chitinivibrionales bacterium]